MALSVRVPLVKFPKFEFGSGCDVHQLSVVRLSSNLSPLRHRIRVKPKERMTNPSTSNTLKSQIAFVIESCTAHLPKAIPIYTDINQSINIIDDKLSEVIHAYCHRTLCGGSGGGGWDHKDNGEDKNSSHVQSYLCPECKQKVVFFARKCPHCGSKVRGKNPRDGRWGISASSHFKYFEELKEYRLQLIEPKTDDPECREFRVRYWVIDKNSVHLNNYARGQLASDKSNHINFQPLKQDFYLSGPVLKYDGILRVLDDRTKFDFSFFDMDNKTPEIVPEEFRLLESASVVASKKFGKNRGTWKRR